MALPAIFMELVPATLETGGMAKEALKELGKEIGKQLEEHVFTEGNQELVKEFVDDFIKEISNEVVQEVLAELDPELQAIAASVMSSYAKKGIENWTGIELGESNLISIEGQDKDGAFHVEIPKNDEMAIQDYFKEGGAFDQLIDKLKDGERLDVILQDKFYDLPNNIIDAIKEKLEEAEVNVVFAN
jgi:hypothetical protein